MSTIRVASTGTVEERLRRLEECANYEEEIIALPLVNAEIKNATAGLVGVTSMPWALLRKLLPDDRWAIYLCGFIKASTTATVSLVYLTDTMTTITIASGTVTPVAIYTKRALGPFAVRGPLAVPTLPQGEEIQAWGLDVGISGGGNVDLFGWTLWLRMTPRNV